MKRAPSPAVDVRGYVALPFARALNPDAQDGVAAALRGATHTRRGPQTDEPLSPEAVTVDETGALVEFALDVGRRTTLSLTDHRTGYAQALAEWHRDHGPLVGQTAVGGDPPCGTLTSDALDGPSGRETLRDALRDRTPDETLDAPSEACVVVLAPTPTRLDDETAAVLRDHTRRLVDNSGSSVATQVREAVVTPAGVALFTSPFAAPVVADGWRTQVLRRVPDRALPDDVDLRDRYAWPDGEVLSLFPALLDDAGARDAVDVHEAVRQRLAQRGPVDAVDAADREPLTHPGDAPDSTVSTTMQ